MSVIGTNENPEKWSKQVFEAIKDLSDIELQKLTWSGKHPEFISSFTETISMLYDDLDFERYIEYFKIYKNKNDLLNLLIELDSMITSYEDLGYEIERKVEGYKIILDDLKWISITEKAKEIIGNWDKRAT